MLPIIGALLANALPLIANAALAKGNDFVKEKTGVDLSTATLSQEQLTTLRKYEMEHEEELLRIRLDDDKLNVELQKAYLADTQDARKRDVAIAESANASWLQKNTGAIMAMLTVALTFCMFYFFVTLDMAQDSPKKDIVIYILGVLSTITTNIFAYYFGSSAGSAAKTNTIDRALRREQEKP